MKGNFFHVEISSQRQQSKSCLICFKDFSVMVKEHQCKRCKRAVCDRCAQNKMIILGYSKSKDPHRVCNICKQESDMLKSFVRTHNITFNQDSVGNEWLQNIGISQKQIKEQYRVEESKDLMEFNQFNNQVDQIYDDIEKKVSYSTRDFLSLAIKIDKATVIKTIRNVVGTFLKNFPEVGYHPTLIMTTLIFLCISNEATTYQLLKMIYTQIIPKPLYFRNLRLGYDFKSEITVILNTLHNLKIPSESIKPFLQEIGSYIISLTINALEIQTSLFLISQLFQEDGYHEFVKCFACALSVHQFKDNLEKNKVLLLWNVKEQQFQKYYYETKKMRCNSSSTIRSLSESQQNIHQDNELHKLNESLKEENSNQKKELSFLTIKNNQQKLEIEKLNDQVNDLKEQVNQINQNFSRIETENANLMEQNQGLKLQIMKSEKINDSSSFTQSTKSDTQQITQLENELLKCKQEIEVLKLQNSNPNQMTQLVKIKNEQIAKLSKENQELEKRIEELEQPRQSNRTSSVASISTVIKDLEDGKNLLEKKNQEILSLKKQITEMQLQKKQESQLTALQEQNREDSQSSKNLFGDDLSGDIQLLLQDKDPAKKVAARNVKQQITKLSEELIYLKTQVQLKKEQVEPFRQKSESLQKQLDFIVDQNKELQIEVEHKQDLINELQRKRMEQQLIETKQQIIKDDRQFLNENKQTCASKSDCIIF